MHKPIKSQLILPSNFHQLDLSDTLKGQEPKLDHAFFLNNNVIHEKKSSVEISANTSRKKGKVNMFDKHCQDCKISTIKRFVFPKIESNKA